MKVNDMKKPEQVHIGYLLKQINDKIEASGNFVLKEYGMTFAQSRVLACLEDAGGQATQKEIEGWLGVTHPTIVGIISRMERDGFVRCWQDEHDRRIKNVQLTEKADQVAEVLQASIEENEKDILACFSRQEGQELVRLLIRLNDYLGQQSDAEKRKKGLK